jgi:hypothetical protein
MADDDKAKAGDDPWAGLESEQLPEATEGFSFAFEDAPSSPADEPVEAMAAGSPGDADADAAEDAATEELFNSWVEEPEEKADEDESGPELSVFQSDDDDDESSDGESSEDDPTSAVIGQSSLDIGTSDSGIPEASRLASLISHELPEDASPFDEIGGRIEAEASVKPVVEAEEEEEVVAADALDDAAMDDAAIDDASGIAGSPFEFTAAAADDDAGDAPEESDEANPFAFAASATSDDASDPASMEGEEAEEAPFDFAAAMGEEMVTEGADEESADDAVPMFDAPAAAADTPPSKATGKKAARPVPAKKKKPSMIGQMVGVVVGGAMSIPIVIGILWWAAGKDTFKVAPMMPDALSFLVPAKFRSGGQTAATMGSGNVPSLDDVLGGGGSDDVAMTDPPVEPVTDLVVPDPEPVEPSDTDLASVTPQPTGSDEERDPLMDLLNEEEPTAPLDPPLALEPEPLDTASLETAAENALAALDAVQSVDDPSDPVMKKLLVECYKSLAGYAQELAMLERVAADSGRPLATMPTAVASIDVGLASRPELFESLARLTRDWMNYPRRSSDGVVAPVTFLSARQVGPYWRAEVTLGDKPIVVLTRSEPAVAAGETVMITGLAIDGNVVWATQVKPAKAADPLFGP